MNQVVDRATKAATAQAKAMRNMHEAEATKLVQESKPTFFGRLTSHLNTVMNVLMLAPLAGGAIGWLNKKKGASATGALSKVEGALKLPDATFGELRTKVGEVFGEQRVAGALKTVSDNTLVQKASGTKLIQYAKDSAGKHEMLGAMATRMKQNSVSSVIFNGGFAVQQLWDAKSDYKEKKQTLEQMQFDLTGSREMSGKLHPLIERAQDEAKSFRARAGMFTKIAGGLVSGGFALFGKSTGMGGALKAMGIGMGTTFAANMMSAGDTAVKSYHDMTLSMAQTGRADMSLYKGLIGGLNKKAPDRLVNEVAQKAFEQQLSASETLKMIAETDFMQKPQIQPVPAKSFVATEAARRAASNTAAYAQRA